MLIAKVAAVRRLAASGLLTLVVLTGCGGGDGGDRATVKGPVPVKSGLELPGRTPLFGFNDQTFAFTAGPEPALDQGVTAARQALDAAAAGANSARITVAWYGVEPTPGRYDRAYIARLKAYTDRVERAGGRVLLTLGVPPRWASAAPTATAAIRDEPELVEAFGRYARYVAEAWPRAAAIEVWNEPNTTFFWKPRAPEPALYARMHKAAAAGIRSAGTGVPVLLAGLLGVDRNSNEILRPAEFLQGAFKAGLETSDYDGVAYHAYPVAIGRRLAPLSRGIFADALAQFTAAVRLVGGGQTPPVWITETGLTRTGAWSVSDRDQARGLLDLLALLSKNPDVAAIYVHTLYEPTSQPKSSIERGFGLLRAQGAKQGAPTLAFCALRRAAGAPGSFAGCPPS